ncbi:tumor necrosis factor receptor superfamily member wengen [Onthophagus taurus]|uniref:tumor necrosis factor receptor superfamily member wengen n=1 Tax=Onthophagus taurus TaxID=166361 RepID=UPI000C200C31|nr:tumor necrosis factor receptor superfamily member wengen [Onthophagus taurus]XP_022912482.1 tumor necrosis factor receptor superfamily member wengen [Onthophagus taurus]
MTNATFLLLPIIFTLTLASVCTRREQYYNHDLQSCVNCTICDDKKGMVVFRPCEIHQDTVCSPFSKVAAIVRSENDIHNHRHHHMNRDHRRKEEHLPIVESTLQISTEVPFSKVETLIWDWQAIALSVAILSCIVFFLVISIYSLHQARQWRRLKENFEADVEELSVRLSLMAANCMEKGEILEPNFTHEVRDGHYHNNKCVYLEQLLNVRKDPNMNSGKVGNVYIEENKSHINGKT